MIFDKQGYPKPNGASDWEDSSHLNGILAIFNHPQAIDCMAYMELTADDTASGPYKYIRCPNSQNDFSRDQAILEMSGLLAQESKNAVRLDYIDGRDILPPSVRGLEAIAKHGKASWLSHQWLKCEIWWHSNLQPLEEPFQIAALCISYDRAHGTSYLKSWTQQNKLWRWSIKRYLSELDGSWRDEKDLCDFVVKRIQEMTR